MKSDSDDQTVWPSLMRTAGEASGQGRPENPIAAADHALEEASRIQRSVRHNLKLMEEVRTLREQLRRAQDELDRYRGMHARVVVGMRRMEEGSADELGKLQAENDALLVRHRVHKLLAEHYAITALRLDPETFAAHRDRVLQHVLFQRRKGVGLAQITANDIAFLLL